jgi:cysteinyl-tRNA synthetase
VSIRLYDTATRTVRDFVPVREGSVGIYHCGLTVQAAPHIGHIRKEVAFDVLRRWFDHRGYEVTLIANVTDIDDKILLKSGELQQQWWALAYANERLLHQAYDLLGCLPPSYEPRATGHIPEMLEMIDTLVDKGHAYVAEDGSGDVYFDVRSWPTYGELSNQRIEDMEAATDADPRGKRDPRDFALWKGHKAGSRTRRVGRHRGGAGARAGTWSARRWSASTSARSSTSMAAGSTCAFRTTRTRWRSRGLRGTASRATGCTTRWSPPPARR